MKIFYPKILFIFLVLLFYETVFPQWEKVTEVSGSSCILSLGDTILVGTNNGVYCSLDNGLHWSQYAVDTTYPIITDLVKNQDYIFAGTYNGVYASSDTGKTWISLGPPFSILSVYARDSVIFACIHGGGLYRSENNGQSWTFIDGNHFYSYLLYDNKIFTGTFTGIYVSRDYGLTWDFAALPNNIITSLSKNDTYFFAANYTHGIFRSDDYGISWSPSNQGLPLDLLHPYTVFARDSLIFAGLTSNKIYLSINNGLDWQDFSTGIDIGEETYHVKFALSGSKIFVSFLYNSLWYYDLSQITKVPVTNNGIPQKFILQQNHPNPFNQSTRITYSVSRSDHIILRIHDVRGKEIITLVNNVQRPDTYSVNFNASELSSGIYFYTLKIGNDCVQARKMLLIR